MIFLKNVKSFLYFFELKQIIYRHIVAKILSKASTFTFGQKRIKTRMAHTFSSGPLEILLFGKEAYFQCSK
jgi:hypothetical protein